MPTIDLASHIIDSAGTVETLPTCPYQGRQCMEGVVPLKVGQPLFAKKSIIMEPPLHVHGSIKQGCGGQLVIWTDHGQLLIENAQHSL